MASAPSNQPSSATSSSGPVWAKRVGDAAVADANISYCAGYDVAGRQPADARLAEYDLQTNAAHVIMLAEQQIIPADAAKKIAGAFLQLREKVTAGEQILRPAAEDIHMSIEAAAGEMIGAEASGHIHTGRSRNDQVATDMRLWLRDQVVHSIEEIAVLGEAIATHARQHPQTVCPGFTHGQPGMVTSWGHWTMSYLPRLLRDARALAALLPDLVTCPLGAAASYGTSWPVNRMRTAELLGFQHPTPSGCDGIWSRGETESRYAFALAQYLSHLGSIGQDIILLTTTPRLWLRLADEHVTGSSIMPQKRNPDFAEVTRARAANAAGIAQSLLGISMNLQSGYNRDSQWTKYLIFDAADNASGAGALFGQVFDKLQVNADAMLAACQEGFLNATDVADFLARSRKIPFRATYKIVGGAVKDAEKSGRLTREIINAHLEGAAPLTAEEWATLEDPRGLLEARKQPGNPQPAETLASIEILLSEIREVRELARAKAGKWRNAVENTFKELSALAGK
ncbi:argininosuccinate lyase [soil metagenome]